MTLDLASLEAVPVPEFIKYHKGHTSRNAAHLEFIAWDGEGITPDGQRKQNYVLFGNSRGYSRQSYSLTSDECLQLIIDTEMAHPNAIHFGFGFSYDAEMILRDVPIKQMTILKQKGAVIWHGYRIEYRKGKWFQISKRVGKAKVACRIWDVISFFGTTLAVALREYLGEIPELDAIEKGKEGRKTFAYADLDSFIIPYWKTELKYMVLMMNSLRERLYGADLRIRQWHGPGAIATNAMKTYKVADHMCRDIPEDVSQASQYAYAGGRFELFKIGRERNGVYAYDIRSAYPSAITELPSLSNGEWRHVDSPTQCARFGIYRVRFASKAFFTGRPMPFFYRDMRHAIHYPNIVEGWYWSPEASLAFSLGNDARVIEGWEYDEDGSRPFAWVNDIYDRRAQWKREGNPSQIALKLLLNSMYGKFAQRVGWERAKEGVPTWHQLEWAGFITSHARARLFKAMLYAYKTNSLIGVETDGIFSRTPLPLDIGQGLGQWEEDHYDEMIYLQSGFYFKKVDGEWKAKYRGFDRGTITVNDAERALSLWTAHDGISRGSLTGRTTRFASLGSYLQSSDPEGNRNIWTTADRTLSLGIDGKRIHRVDACKACDNKESPNDALHDMTITHPVGAFSQPHLIPWKPIGDNPFRSYIDADEAISFREGWFNND